MTFPKCLIANAKDIFCIHAKLFRLDSLGESLRYVRPCPCAVCSKITRVRRRIGKIAVATPPTEGTCCYDRAGGYDVLRCGRLE